VRTRFAASTSVGAPLARAPADPAVLGAMFLVGVFINTCAASINTHVFLWAAPLAVAWFRQVVAGVVLIVIAVASRERVPGATSTWGWMVLWGFALALNTGAFYAAVSRIPLGVATTLSFVGPVTVAALGSHRRRDLVWVACAGIGVLAIAQPSAEGYDPLGLAIGLSGGAGWAILIVAGSRVVRSWGPTLGAASATTCAALVLAPFALFAGGFPVTNPRATGILLCTASVGAALPYMIDMRVMQRLAPATFSVLQSLFPGVGVLVGLLLLGQIPGVFELIGVAAVSIASVGALRAAARAHRIDREATGSLPLP
jgi:inner membrane transporter RhtA